MTIKNILKIGLVAIVASALSTAEARPKGKKSKPTPQKKVDREKPKKGLKAASDKRDKRRSEAKKKGHNVRQKGKAFGKIVRNDQKIKELRKAFAEASKKMKSGFDKSKFKDATDEQKEALREKIKASRKDWEEASKKHRTEIRKRITEIKKEFANKRDKVIDGNKPGK